jgi:hypothetical protein
MRRPQIAEFCGLFWPVLTEQSRGSAGLAVRRESSLCVSLGGERPLIGGPRMSFENDLTVARYAEERS